MNNGNKWILGCIRPECGLLADGYYDAGTMLKDDKDGPNEESSRMQVVCGVNKNDFIRYTESIKESGARIYLTNQMCEDACIGFEYNRNQYHVMFSSKREEIRVIEDPSTIPVDRFEYSDTGDKPSLVIPYALYHDPRNQNTKTTINCGMIYIIRLSDGSLFVVDGGYILQHSEQANTALWEFMYDIADKQDNGKIRISCWYFTHGHDDHMDGCTRLLTRFHDKIDLERVMHGFQSRTMCGGFSETVADMRNTVKKYYPNVKTLKMHTGQRFNLSNMSVDVLYASEDVISAESLTTMPLRDFNSTTTVVNLTINGKKFILLGDIGNEVENYVEKYGNPTLWKADMVQVAHHCFNDLPKLYSWVNAPVATVPNRYYGAHAADNINKLREVLKYVKNDKISYDGDSTIVYEATENGFVRVAEYPIVGGEFDLSWNLPSRIQN